ncbi:pseudoazurin [Aliiroseovarius sp. 2305UL8-7]|uniref:pseudoazurin n=1 Tax=Aliiroseovarius conchicola TaxID=3121637 RepID=UPI003529BDCB
MNRRTALGLLATSALVLTVANPSFAAPQTHVVEMKKGDIFTPALLYVSIGDTVRFVNVSGSHNTESIPGMIPDGVAPWKSRMRKTFDLIIEKEGVYGYKCTPHYSKGMVGLIVAGDPAINLAAARSVKNPPRSQAVFERLFAQIG